MGRTPLAAPVGTRVVVRDRADPTGPPIHRGVVAGIQARTLAIKVRIDKTGQLYHFTRYGDAGGNPWRLTPGGWVLQLEETETT